MRNGILRFVACLFIGVVIVLLSSCNKEDDPQAPELGSITGEVTDNDGQAIADVDVTVSSVNEDDISVATDADGSFLVENLPLKTHTVTFSKAGWLTVSTTVSANQFDDNNAATADATMVNTSAKISGTVTDAKNNDAPLSGVSVSTESDTTTTGEDGTFLIENLLEGDYTITFTKDTYETVTEEVVAADFVDGVATVDVTMGADEVLRGFTQEDLVNADKWYYNEYRGGRNADAYPHWDWATDYMSALDFQGAWQEQNEGTTLQIRNGEEDQGNPADLDVFDSFVYGSKLITEDNKILSVRLRTHDADEAAPAYYGVQVVDLSAAQPEAVKVGENRTYGSEDYADIEFDLSAYVGKEVIVAIGIYRQATGDYWKQLVLRAIRFAGQKVEGTNWLPGTAVIQGWEQLTLENVRSTMTHTESSFTGISPVGGDRDNYVDGYRSWRDINHIAAEWALVPLKKDPEVFASEGYIIKTRDTPESEHYRARSIYVCEILHRFG